MSKKNIAFSEWMVQPKWIEELATISETIAKDIENIKEISKDVDDIKAGIEAQKELNNKLLADNAETRASVGSMKSDVDKLESELTEMQDALNTHIQNEKELIQEIVDEAIGNIDLSDNDYYKKLVSDINSNKTEIESISSELLTLSNTVSENNTNTTKSIDDLRTDVERTSQSISTLSTKLDRLKQKIGQVN